jgi:Flp pilus assembly protein TadG
MSSKILTIARESRTRDQGAITLLVVVFFVALLAAAGLVVDGGAKLRAAREASAVSEEAARAGAGRIDRDRAYLASSGNTGSVSIIGAQKIRVTVTVSKPTLLLSAIGIDDLHVTKTATADLLQGVDRPTSSG